MPRAQLLDSDSSSERLLEQPRLQDRFGVKLPEAQRLTRNVDYRFRWRQADKLASHYAHTPRGSLTSDALEHRRHGRTACVEQVHRHLYYVAIGSEKTARLDSRQAAARFADAPCDCPRNFDIAGCKCDVVGDQRPPCADRCRASRSDAQRTKVRRQLRIGADLGGESLVLAASEIW